MGRLALALILLLGSAEIGAYTLFLQPTETVVSPFAEVRQCGAPARGLDGKIQRNPAVLAAFRIFHPCPVTGRSTGACPGWALDHVVSLVCGGCDAVSNLAWMPDVIKSGPGPYPKDRWEQRVYCRPQRLTPMPLGESFMLVPLLATSPQAPASSGSSASGTVR